MPPSDPPAVRPQPFRPPASALDAQARLAAWVATLAPGMPLRCAVVHPCDEPSLRAALEAAGRGLVAPRLVAPEARLLAVAAAAGLSLAGVPLDPVPHSHAAAARGAALAAAGEVELLVKGSLHTDELMAAVIGEAALRTKRRMSHVFRLDIPAYPKPLLLTDAAINIRPTLEDKRDIVQNAIELAQALGVAQPRVALLAAIETVTPKLQSTLDAAALCKMADRGQITGALLDGPLAFDNAVSLQAAQAKGLVSPVAGQADILVVPELEAGNMLAKQLEYLAGAASCGVVMGARVPIALTSRSDGVASRVASIALAALLAQRWRTQPP